MHPDMSWSGTTIDWLVNDGEFHWSEVKPDWKQLIKKHLWSNLIHMVQYFYNSIQVWTYTSFITTAVHAKSIWEPILIWELFKMCHVLLLLCLKPLIASSFVWLLSNNRTQTGCIFQLHLRHFNCEILLNHLPNLHQKTWKQCVLIFHDFINQLP